MALGQDLDNSEKHLAEPAAGTSTNRSKASAFSDKPASSEAEPYWTHAYYSEMKGDETQLQCAIAQLAIDGPRNFGGHRPRLTHKRAQLLRKPSMTPSSTSDSDKEDTVESIAIHIDEETKSWLDLGENNEKVDRKGKGKASQEKNGICKAVDLPPEILLHIFRHLPSNADLLNSLLVCRFWCLCAFSLLWHRPNPGSITSLAAIIRVIHSKNSSLPYANAIKRLPLNQVGPILSDELLLPLSVCVQVERLNINGAVRVTADTLKIVIASMPNILSLDLTGVVHTDDSVMEVIGEKCRKIQAINISDCKLVGDDGIMALVGKSRSLRRVKFDKCHRISERSLIPLIRTCPLVLEYDFQALISLSNAVLHTIFLCTPYLRELRVNVCVALTDKCVPCLSEFENISDDQIAAISKEAGLNIDKEQGIAMYRPLVATMEYLRVVDFTACTELGDQALDNLITNAPKIRQLTLNRCSKLTDKSLYSIGRLGKHLHNLHLGHVDLITDNGVIQIARNCTRLRYIDLACCTLLTDACIIEIGENLSKLRRFGLVKCQNITDAAIYSLIRNYATLERIHLSYCDQLSVKAIAYLLNRLPYLKHLSLTGVPSFRVSELQAFGRAPPQTFNDHQRSSFCVFSGSLIDTLRDYLNERYLPSMDIDTSEGSTHDGAASSASSLTIPGGFSTPPGQPALVYRPSYSNSEDVWDHVSPGIPSEAFQASAGTHVASVGMAQTSDGAYFAPISFNSISPSASTPSPLPAVIDNEHPYSLSHSTPGTNTTNPTALDYSCSYNYALPSLDSSRSSGQNIEGRPSGLASGLSRRERPNVLRTLPHPSVTSSTDVLAAYSNVSSNAGDCTQQTQQPSFSQPHSPLYNCSIYGTGTGTDTHYVNETDSEPQRQSRGGDGHTRQQKWFGRFGRN
ncbi:hypothetical protein L204_101179 [Cryptococcus depauperatus]|nr:hypothetical protein L204_00888 [Cryptococcus depauperatus CBS 7855]